MAVNRWGGLEKIWKFRNFSMMTKPKSWIVHVEDSVVGWDRRHWNWKNLNSRWCHLGPISQWSGSVWICSKSRISKESSINPSHQSECEVYQIFPWKSILHRFPILWSIHHLDPRKVFRDSKKVSSWKNRFRRWIKSPVNKVLDLVNRCWLNYIKNDFRKIYTS